MKVRPIYLLFTVSCLHTFSALNAQDHPKEEALHLQGAPQDKPSYFKNDDQYRLGKEAYTPFSNEGVLKNKLQSIGSMQVKGVDDDVPMQRLFKDLDTGKIQGHWLIDTSRFGKTVPMPNAMPMIVMENGSYSSNMPWKKVDGSDCVSMPNAFQVDDQTTSIEGFRIIRRENVDGEKPKKDRPDQ